MQFYRQNRQEFALIFFFTLLKLILHFSANSNYGFHRDELLYLALGDHLDWGFKEVPPFIAGIAWLTSNIFGDSVFATRIISSFFGAMIVFLTGLTVLTMGGKRFSITVACLAVLVSPAFLASGYLLQPVVFDQFFWVLASYLIVCLIKTRQDQYILAFGLTVGIGMLNKYSMAFCIIALLAALLLTPQRKILLNKTWIGAAAIAFLVFLPNLVWQIYHDLPVIKHMQELKETQLNFMNPVDFIIQQLLVHATASIIWLTGFVYLLFSKTLKEFRFLAPAYFLVILLLILLQGKPYYSFGAYPMLFAVGGIAVSNLLSRLQYGFRFAAIAAVLIPSMVFLPMVVPILPFNSTLRFFSFTANQLSIEFPLKWEDQKLHATTQDYADMLGWEELAKGASKSYELIPKSERNRTTIFANNYGQAGALDHYRKKYGLPATVSFSSSYVLWSPKTIQTRYLIFIDDEYPDDLRPSYKSVVKIAEIRNPYARERGTSVYLLSDPVKDIMPIYTKHRQEELN